jgi:hypothetical protein
MTLERVIMTNIEDPKIWEKLALSAKIKWLQIKADNEAQRCTSCEQYLCTCGDDI